MIKHHRGLFALSPDHSPYAISGRHAFGHLDVGDGHHIYWEARGNPAGKPALVVHGGPGSGATEYLVPFFDPDKYRIILLDQRGCGRSRPHAGETVKALQNNTTQDLIRDMEKLRTTLSIDRWMLFGGSWGTTLSLAYAEAHPKRISEMVLWGVVTTTQAEVRWLTWEMGHIFPEEFAALCAPVKDHLVDQNIPLAYNKLLTSSDADAAMAASRAWCAWEDRIVSLGNHIHHSPRYEDDLFRLGFARLVTHYFGHHAFLADDHILQNVDAIKAIPTLMVRGRLDISSRLSASWRIFERHPLSDIYLIDDSGHGGSTLMSRVLVGATDYFASPR